MPSSENKYIIDKRSREDVVKEIDSLAKSYTPQWKFDVSNPDMGSSIALIFAHLLSGSIARANLLNDKSHRELADLLELSPYPATPAQSVVRFSLSDTVDDGVMIPKGTKLFAQGEDGEPVHFETVRTIYATTAMPEKLFISNSVTGKLIEANLPMSGEADIKLGDSHDGNFLSTALTLTHPYAFCFEKGSTLRIHFDGREGTNKILSEKELFQWSFWSERGFVPFEKVWFDKEQDSVSLQAGGASALWEDKEEFAVRVTSLVPAEGKIAAKGIYLDTESTELAPEEVWCSDLKVEANNFTPFGDMLSVFSECYIACEPVLTQCGAKILMKFELALSKKILKEQEAQQQELKVIMRRKQSNLIIPTDVYANEVSFEYFNGIGWNRLPLSNASDGIFAGERQGAVALEFICPKDIEPIELNAFFKNWIRIRVIKSDGCYAPNAIHHYPVIKNLSFSHAFGRGVCQPSRVYRMAENRLSMLGDFLRFSEECTLFEPMSLAGYSLLLGFKQPLHGGPLSLYFEIENSSMLSDFRITARYSSSTGDNGFRALQTVDFTEGFSHSGGIVFAIPPDMRKRTVFGEEKFWIYFSIVNADIANRRSNIKIKKVYLNGVEVTNKFTHKAENFYLSPLDNSTAMQLSATDILSADVFVNEAISMGEDEKKKILAERPADVRCTYDSLGSVQSFFVRWSEVNNFGGSKPNDRHYMLDRVNSRLIFSDGMQAMSPPKQPDVAVSVTAVSTAGSRGNVAAHSINGAYESLEYVDRIDNSLPACNGSDIESREQLLERASILLRSGNRIITAEDLCKAMGSMNNLVAKVKVIDEDNDFTFLVLPRDFERSSEMFNTMKEKIKNEIFSRWEISAKRSNFVVKQPDYLAVFVTGWLVIDSGSADMELLGAVEQQLRNFLNPISGGFSGKGWEIGNIPNRVQILSVIRSVCPGSRVENLCVTGRIYGEHGVSEYDLQMKNVLPQAICVSGKHHILAKLEVRGE